MTDDDDWDDDVDVLCVGAGPGSLAYGILCAAAGLEVVIVTAPHLDPATQDYRDAMTEDLGDGPADPTLAMIRAEPIPPATGKRVTLEPFVGEELRRWSAGCLHSPFGVLLTEVPDLAPMRDEHGRSISVGSVGGYRFDGGAPGPALVRWLRDRADGLFAPEEDRVDGLIFEEGRIAGATLDTAGGPRRVRAAAGLALALGADPEQWPDQPELAGLSADVAVVGRRGGRFARVELLVEGGRP